MFLGGRKYLIETKRQSVAGSVDEKLPYVFLNARENYPEFDFVLVLDGNGWKPGARKWVETKAAAYDGFDVLSIEGFKIWLGIKMRKSGL